MILQLNPDNTARIKFVGLMYEELDGTETIVNDAVMSVTLLDLNQKEVEGQSWPVTMNYIAGTDGDYAAELIDTLSISDGESITAKVVATWSGKKLTIPQQVNVVERA